MQCEAGKQGSQAKFVRMSILTTGCGGGAFMMALLMICRGADTAGRKDAVDAKPTVGWCMCSAVRVHLSYQDALACMQQRRQPLRAQADCAMGRGAVQRHTVQGERNN